MNLFSDDYFMKKAIEQAHLAKEKGEVPVGAVVVFENQIIARAHNLTQTLNDVTAHAEMQAFTAAANAFGGKYLHNCSLYVTLEPCIMCAGAAYWTQISRLVYGTPDKKRGMETIGENLLHPKTQIVKGILKDECSQLLKDFFEKKR